MSSYRKPKKGIVYLLKSNNKYGFYKFGCTTKTSCERCKNVNAEQKRKGVDYDFSVLLEVKSKDIFKLEQFVRNSILPYGLGFLSEIIEITSLGITEVELKDKFLGICDV